MKQVFVSILLGLSLACVTTAGAQGDQKQVKKIARAKKKSAHESLQTDVHFNDSVLRGQYQVPEEALAKVENEKEMSDLLGVRKHFKDRLQRTQEQE